MKRLAGNTVALMVAQAGTRLSSLIVVLLIGRLLGPDGLGIYAMAGAVASLALVLADAGLDMVTIRTMARGEPAAAYLGALLPARLGLGVVAIAVAGVGALLAGYPAAGVVLTVVLTAAAVLEILAAALRTALRAAETMASEAALVLVGQFSRALLISVALLAGLGVGGIGGAATVGGAISLAVTAVVIVRRFGGLQPRVDWPLWRATARETLPITIWLILIQLGSRSDAILIGHWWPAAEAGRFHAASGVLASLNLVVAMTLAALYPALVRARAAGSEQDVRRLTLPLLVGGLALTTVVAMLAPLVIEPLLILLLGDRFVEAGPPLTVLRWALPALVVTGVAGAVLRSHGQDRALAWQALLGAVVSLTLNVTLIPAHGAIGAAASTLSAELAMAGFGVVLLRRNGLSTLQPATLGIAIGAAAGGTGLVAAHLAGQTWWLAALAGAAAAGAVLLTTALLVVGLRQDGRQTIGAAWSLMRRPSR